MATLTAPQAAAQNIEDELKAAFLYNFASFTEWPPRSTLESSPQLVLCIAGNDSFGKALERIESKAVRNKKIAVKRLAAGEHLDQCHMLYVGRAGAGNLAQILEAAQRYHILTVGDGEGYGQQGVMINLLREQNKLAFEINLDAAKRAKLNISSKLLRLARTIY